MKVYVMVAVVIMSFCTAGVSYGVELIETDSLIIMYNNWMHVEINKATGDIHTLGIKTVMNVLPEGTSIQFTFQDTSDFEYYQIEHGTVDSLYSFNVGYCVGAHFFISFDSSTYIAHVVYTLYDQELRWDVDLKMPDNGVRGAKIDFLLPVVYAMDYVFWTTDGAPFELGGSSLTSCDVVYRNKCVLPAFIFYDDISDIGISFVSPFDMKKPGLSYHLDANQSEDPFRISNYYLRLGDVDTARASIYFVPHDGCWRPGLAWMYDTYAEYFDPVCSSLLDGEGWYYMSSPAITDDDMADAAARGVTWEQWHGHFPFYGYYAPDNLEGWSLLHDQDDITFEYWLDNPIIKGYPYNSYDTNNIKIEKWWKDHNVQSYIYYQPCEAWDQFAKYLEGFLYRGNSYNFASSIARRQDGSPHTAWQFCHLLNPDTSGDWGKFSIAQLEYLLYRHPDVHGIFLDRDDYWNYDYAHDDGVTMIDTDTVYMYGFALEQINGIITSMVHALPGKGIWTNGPTSIEVCKAMDGIMSEAAWQVPYEQYLGLSRPMILLLYDKIPSDTETKLKLALYSGHFPSIMQSPRDATALKDGKELEQRYRSLFDLYKGKQWVLYPHPLHLCDGVKGNIFSIEANGQTNVRDYLISIVSDDKSQLIPEYDLLPDPFEYDIWAEVTVPEQNDMEYCYLLSGDVAGVQELSVGFSGNELHVHVPAHMVSSLIHLAPEPRYKVTRLSMPVQVRGYQNSFEANVFNLSDTTEEYKIRLLTPSSWSQNREVKVRIPPHKSKTLKVDYAIPDDHALGEDSTTQVYFRLPYVDRVYLPTWVVDEVSFQVPELLFVKFEDGDTFSCCLVNNMPYQVQVNLAGEFVTGSGSIYFLSGIEPLQTLYIDSLEREDFLVVVEPDMQTTEDTVTISAIIANLQDTITIRRPVETALFHQEGDLFWDDFSSGSMGNWAILSGDWLVDNDAAKGSGTPSHFAVRESQTQEWHNYTLQANTKIEGSDQVPWLKSYIFFRYQDPSNFYRFGIHGDAGVIDLYKRVPDDWIHLDGYTFTPERDTWYNLRIEVKGDTIKGYIDGQLVIHKTDITFSYGGIGIGVREDSMITWYDDVIVRPIE